MVGSNSRSTSVEENVKKFAGIWQLHIDERSAINTVSIKYSVKHQRNTVPTSVA